MLFVAGSHGGTVHGGPPKRRSHVAQGRGISAKGGGHRSAGRRTCRLRRGRGVYSPSSVLRFAHQTAWRRAIITLPTVLSKAFAVLAVVLVLQSTARADAPPEAPASSVSLFAVGGAALASGVAMLVLNQPRVVPADERPHTAVAPIVGRGTVGLSIAFAR